VASRDALLNLASELAFGSARHETQIDVDAAAVLKWLAAHVNALPPALAVELDALIAAIYGE
jgi:hypothetical protein